MSTRKRIFLGTVGVAIIAIALVASHLRMPQSWKTIHREMSRQQVVATAGGEYVDNLDLKGFDVFTQNKLRGSSYWQLLVTYDGADKIATAYVHFIHRDCGLFNSKPKSLL